MLVGLLISAIFDIYFCLMKKLILTVLISLYYLCANSQVKQIDKVKIEEDLNEILEGISKNYIYLTDKNVKLNCVREYYRSKIATIKTDEDVVLFFEYLLNEFYDSHLTLNTNRKSSYRLYSPVYITYRNGKSVISNVWQTQVENLDQEIIGSEVHKINGIEFEQAINDFPTHCHDKKSEEVREWIGNKILAGRYDQPRVLTLKRKDGSYTDFDLDNLKIKSSERLLTTERINGIGYIRIHNSLGDNELIAEFDKSLDSLFDTQGLIIDLRNTVDGGNSYVARGIMGRFIDRRHSYQMHWRIEKYENGPAIERSWTEYVSPRLAPYKKPLIILVGRWTGSMGEGLAIGFDGMGRADIIGSEMERLAGSINGFSLKNQTFGYRVSVEKLYHLNGMPREKYVPTIYVKQTTTQKDQTLEKGIEVMSRYQKKIRRTKSKR
jgi:C-terminal processing protease CtpA/Prc